MNPPSVIRIPGLWSGLLALALGLAGAPAARAQQISGATFGDVISVGGTPSDVVLDEARGRLYLVRDSANRVDIYDYRGAKAVIGSISVGRTPLAAAMSPDGQWLYVTNNGTTSLSVVDLASVQVNQTILLPSRPEGVEVGADGRALVSMIGTGVTAGVPQGTLAVIDKDARQGQQVQAVQQPALPSTPAPLPATVLTRPITTFRSKLLRTPDGQFIVGAVTPTNNNTYIFVYEVNSGMVLRNRTVSGTSTVLSMAKDGSRFMAGMTMYDTATLSVLAQENIANAPFTLGGNFNQQQNFGGSAFSPDGGTLYSAFNVAGVATPAPRPQSSTLLIGDSTNMGIRLGIKLPESVVAKMVMTSDGSEAWGMSESGLIHLPLGKLYEYPILAPETTTVFLSQDECNRGIVRGTLRVNNLGKGRLTYSVATSTSAALIYELSSGLAPSTVTFTMDPGRSGVQRRPGTNIWTGAGTFSGASYNIQLASSEAINLPPVIRIYMNYRQADQRGVVYPINTMPNNNPTSSSNSSGNEGLQSLLLDEARGKLYITNSGYNRIEVFDLKKQRFVEPILVGQLPHQMVMSSDGNTMYVANVGGESLNIVDLNLMKVVDNVVFPPIPRNGTVNPVYVRTMAMGQFGLQFVMSNGTQWKLVGNQATVRAANSVIPNTLGGGPNFSMTSTPGGEYILTLAGNGMAYLYDASVDTYTAGRLLFNTPGNPIQGYYGVLGAGPGGAYYLANGLILNSSMTIIGGSERPGATAFTPPPAPGQPPTQTVVNTGQRNVAAVAPLTDTIFVRLTTPVRQNITVATRDDERPTLEMVNLTTGEETLVGVAPENPVVNALGTARINVASPRQMVVDSKGTVYAITLSGLSVIPLVTAGNTRPAITTGARGIVNAADGTQNIRPGNFVVVNGSNLAAAANADTVPPPTVLGGSCVTFGDIALPLLQASGGQIQAQVPDTLRPGTYIVQVRSLSTAQASDPVAITVRPGTTSTGTSAPGTTTGVTEPPADPPVSDPSDPGDPGAGPADPGSPPPVL